MNGEEEREMRLPELLENTPVLNVRGQPRVMVRGVTSDSRLVRPGFVFVAIPGQHSDGHRYVGDAAKRGAAAVVAEESNGLPAMLCGVEVEDARRAVADLSTAFYGYPSRRLQTDTPMPQCPPSHVRPRSRDW